LTLTVAMIHDTSDDEALLALLSAELNQFLPKDVLRDPETYKRTLETLPIGLRAMAGMHFFDVSMAIDDLAWHFGNQYDEGALKETFNGLNELELYEVAEIFDDARKLMIPYIEAKQKNEPLEMDPTEWSEHHGKAEQIWEMDARIRKISKDLGRSGLMAQWLIYARKHPDRCIAMNRPV
jgi:hypothetical protein